MAQKKSYSRYFIILQEDENGYSLSSDKLPSGYTKLETKNDKCKVSYYVQNLKKEKEPYYMILICNKKDTKKIIKLGAMNIDEQGRAEVSYEYGVDDVAGSHLSVDYVGGSAIVKIVDSNIISIMSGYTLADAPSDWKNYSVIENASDNTNIEIPSETIVLVDEPRVIPEEIKEEKNIFEEYEQKIEEIKQVEERKEEIIPKLEEQNLQSDDFVIKQEEERKEEIMPKLAEEEEQKEEIIPKLEEEEEHISEPDNFDIINMEPLNEEPEKVEEPIKIEENKNDLEDNGNKDEIDYPTGTIGDFFKLLTDNLEPMMGVCNEIKRCKWYKVQVNTLDDMCNTANYNKYTIIYYPMISYYPYIRKYNHFMLGYKYDAKGKMKYLVYGIPGTKNKLDQPYAGKSGFVTWVPWMPGEERMDSPGYWLMFYDFRTSTIVIPIK